MFMVYCREKGGYTINALPARGKADGTRRFCIDESGRIGCGMEWNRSRKCLYTLQQIASCFFVFILIRYEMNQARRRRMRLP